MSVTRANNRIPVSEGGGASCRWYVPKPKLRGNNNEVKKYVPRVLPLILVGLIAAGVVSTGPDGGSHHPRTRVNKVMSWVGMTGVTLILTISLGRFGGGNCNRNRFGLVKPRTAGSAVADVGPASTTGLARPLAP